MVPVVSKFTGIVVHGALLVYAIAHPSLASAQNFAPIARASVEREQYVVGEPVRFSSSRSLDPDGGPQPLSFLWELDEWSSTEPSPTRVFASPRAYAVTLTVSDGLDTAVTSVVVHVLAPPLPGEARVSSPIALSRDGNTLWVVNPDSGTLTTLAVREGSLEHVAERSICTRPRTVSSSEDRVYVACQDARALAVFDVATETVTMVPVGAEPYGVVATDDGGALVTNQGDDSLSFIDANLDVRATIALADVPRALAVSADGARAYVTHFLSRTGAGIVSEINLAARVVERRVRLENDPGPDTASSGRGIPNLLSAIALDPAGRRLWVGGLKSNVSGGLFRAGRAMMPVSFVRGVAAPVDVGAGVEVLARRIDTNDADSVSALTFSRDGRFGYFAHQGAGTVSVYDLSRATLFDPGAGASVPFEGRITTGDAPHGLALARDGRTLYVSNYLSRDVVAIDVSTPAAPTLLARVEVTAEPLSPGVANGKRLFYRSSEPKHSKSNYVACASCHADGGGHDGQVWDFSQDGEGLRNTIDLRGSAGLGRGRLHWSANFDEVQDFENSIVKLFGGTGLAQDGEGPNPPLGPPNAGRSQDLDDLATYVASLSYTPKSPYRQADGSLSDAAVRGQAIFLEPARRCGECHPPPSYTTSGLGTSSLINVGTLVASSGMRAGEPLTGIDVPSLVGAWDGAPYLHDGSAPTLYHVLRGARPSLETSLCTDLGDAELGDLIAFLASLDAPAPVPAPEPPVTSKNGGGCSTLPSELGLALTCLLWLLSSARHERRRSKGLTGK